MARGTAKSSLRTTQLQTLAQVNGYEHGRAGAPEALLTKQGTSKQLRSACRFCAVGCAIFDVLPTLRGISPPLDPPFMRWTS